VEFSILSSGLSKMMASEIEDEIVQILAGRLRRLVLRVKRSLRPATARPRWRHLRKRSPRRAGSKRG